ncbi:hypothetical protein Tco_0752349 [Tanacetum coccineum]|uniref:Uncharacterized protein n=1 Tax=Tanacetum coccineum TaxID=301880 RepID=A0ABQ4ZAB7_9ASTR
METKDTVSLCSVLKDQEIQRLQEKARLSKGGYMNSFRVLQTNTAFLLRKDFLSYNSIPEGAFERAFLQIFGVEVSTFKRIFSLNLDKLEEQLTKDKLHENDFKIALTALKAPFDRFFNYEMQKSLTFESRQEFKKYTGMEPQFFKEWILKDFDFIEKYMLETILHEQEIQKLLNEKKLQTQEVQINTIKALNADSIVMENTYSSKENSSSETVFNKSVKESSLDSETKDVHAIK